MLKKINISTDRAVNLIYEKMLERFEHTSDKDRLFDISVELTDILSYNSNKDNDVKEQHKVVIYYRDDTGAPILADTFNFDSLDEAKSYVEEYNSLHHITGEHAKLVTHEHK